MDVVEVLQTITGSSRDDLWCKTLKLLGVSTVLEVGVWRGMFAERILRECPCIEAYYMIDPWRHLDDWNKPSNVTDAAFEEIFAEALARTDFAGSRRHVLRGKTTEVIDRIPDGSLDWAYIDGDHTLRGITIDLVRTYPKVRPGGVIAGDDYQFSIWHHPENFEPTLVSPFAAYFAESQDATLVILPHKQFAIHKPTTRTGRFRVIDRTGTHRTRGLLPQIAKPVRTDNSQGLSI